MNFLHRGFESYCIIYIHIDGQTYTEIPPNHHHTTMGGNDDDYFVLTVPRRLGESHVGGPITPLIQTTAKQMFANRRKGTEFTWRVLVC